MLHHPPAQRRAANPRPSRRTRLHFTPRLFLGVADLPPGRALHCEEVAPGVWVLLARLGADFGQIAHEYAYNTDLPYWVGPRMYTVYKSVSPAEDAAGYLATHWWDDGWVVDETALAVVAQLIEDQRGPRQPPLVDILDPRAPRLTGPGGLVTM